MRPLNLTGIGFTLKNNHFCPIEDYQQLIFIFRKINIFKMSHNKIMVNIYPDRDLLLCAADLYFLSPHSRNLDTITTGLE